MNTVQKFLLSSTVLSVAIVVALILILVYAVPAATPTKKNGKPWWREVIDWDEKDIRDFIVCDVAGNCRPSGAN